jgi:hypothetical protein
MQGAVVAIDSPMAAQKALPKESSAHAMQLAGSPEQLAGDVDGGCGGATLKMVFKFELMLRRRRGIGG